jgi:hypothetical protein
MRHVFLLFCTYKIRKLTTTMWGEYLVQSPPTLGLLDSTGPVAGSETILSAQADTRNMLFIITKWKKNVMVWHDI